LIELENSVVHGCHGSSFRADFAESFMLEGLDGIYEFEIAFFYIMFRLAQLLHIVLMLFFVFLSKF
jgi:hypothetical protein